MEEKKQQIIDVSKKLFAEKGFAGTGLREIAEKAEISIGNIYNYFKNKEEIFNSIFDSDTILKSISDVPKLLKSGFPYNLDKIILTVKKAIDENIEFYSLTFIDLIEFGGKNTNRMIDDMLNYANSIFEERINQNSLVGTVLKKGDYNLFTRLFVISLISSFVTRKILTSANIDNYSDEEVAKTISDIILHGILV